MKTFNSRGADRLNFFDFSFKLYYFILIFIGTGTIFVGLLKLSPEDFQFSYTGPNGANQYSNLASVDPDEALSYFLSIEKKLETLGQEDKSLADYVRIKYLSPPSHRPYPIESTAIAKERNMTTNPIGDFVSMLFDKKKNGTFIDASCTDMTDVLLTSPTLSLEKKFSWKGIIVACNPFTVPSIQLNRRNSWVADVCLSRKSSPHRMHITCNAGGYQRNENKSKPLPHSRSSLFQIMKPSAKPDDSPQENNRVESVEVQAVPLFSIVSAIGWKEVDFLSLELKGYEMDILRNIPFDKVTFKVMQIGIFTYKEKELAELDEYLEMFDYMLVKDRVQQKYRIYVHMSIYEKVYENTAAYASLIK